MSDERRIPGSIDLDPQRALLILGAAVIVLAVCHVVFVILVPSAYPERFFALRLMRFFHLGYEANLPSYWSALVLLAAGALLGLIHLHVRRSTIPSFSRHWAVLALGFVYLSFDEATQIHEGLIAEFWSAALGTGTGITHYVWYLPAIPILIVILLAYLRFLYHLPLRTRLLFIASAVLFVGGAIGMEMVESWLAYHEQDHWFAVSQLGEESLELAGSSLFVYALLGWLSDADARFTLRTAGANAPADRPTHA